MSLAMRKCAVQQAAWLNEQALKCQQAGRKGMAEKLEETVTIVSQEIRATRELLGQKLPLKKASEEFIKEFKEMELDD